MPSIIKTDSNTSNTTSEGFLDENSGTVLQESTPGLKTTERVTPQQKTIAKEDRGITISFVLENIQLCC